MRSRTTSASRATPAIDGARAAPAGDGVGDGLGGGLGRLDGLAAERFAATLAHDLESSLLVIAEHVARLRESAAALSAEQSDRLARVGRTVERMQRLLASVRAFTAAGAVPERERVPLEGVLADVLETLAPLVEQREAAIVAGGPLPVVLADRAQLTQLLQNLISNAVKFGPRRGRVVVEATRGRGRWRIAVSDQGPGIAPEDRERVFAPLERLPGGRTEAGTGLGLAIARRVAESHGGTLSVEAGRGGGATFACVLPDRSRR